MRARSTVVPFLVSAFAVAALAAPVAPSFVQVSLDADGGDPDGYSGEAAVTPNGRYVAFHSAATDLRSAAGNATLDVFVRDMKTGAVDLASHTEAGGEGGNASRYPSISANGRIVAFESFAEDLVPGTFSGYDVFVADRRTGELEVVTNRFDGSPGDDVSTAYGAALSSNGRIVVFLSKSTGIVEGVDTLGYYQVYARDLRKGITTLVSRDRDDPLFGASGTCSNASISPNGRFVAFTCNSANLVPGSSNGQTHVYLRDLKKGTTVRVTQTTEGVLGSASSFEPVVSNNGRWVAFWSYAANLALPHTTGESDAILADRTAGTFVNMSASEGGKSSYTCAISASGKVVVFYSEKSDLVPDDGNATGDVFRFFPATGTLTRLSVNAAGEEGNGYSYMVAPSLASNGKWLVVSSDADNLGDGPEDPGNNTDDFLIRLP